MVESTPSGLNLESLTPPWDGFSLEGLVSRTGYFIIGVFIFFVVLGGLVILGMRTEVSSIISGIFEGTIQVFEIFRFIKELWRTFIEVLKELFNIISPLLAAAIAAVSYYFLMWLYRYVGKGHDVTILTIVLTVVLVSVLNIFWGPGKRKRVASTDYWKEWSSRMNLYLMNSYEIMLFIFFLTLDWQEPVFLSSELWGDITAQAGKMDFMTRGIDWNVDFSFTLWLAGLALLIEIVRRILKILALALHRYRSMSGFTNSSKIMRFKESLIESFNKSLDGIVKFFGYTTVVILVFFAFPRLKLLSLIFFSFTNLVWDVLVPARLLVDEPGQDLLSTLVVRAFRL